MTLKAANRKGSASTSESRARRPSRNVGWMNAEEEHQAKVVVEDPILQSLLYPSITARYSQVAKAHGRPLSGYSKARRANPGLVSKSGFNTGKGFTGSLVRQDPVNRLSWGIYTITILLEPYLNSGQTR